MRIYIYMYTHIHVYVCICMYEYKCKDLSSCFGARLHRTPGWSMVLLGIFMSMGSLALGNLLMAPGLSINFRCYLHVIPRPWKQLLTEPSERAQYALIKEYTLSHIGDCRYIPPLSHIGRSGFIGCFESTRRICIKLAGGAVSVFSFSLGPPIISNPSSPESPTWLNERIHLK